MSDADSSTEPHIDVGWSTLGDHTRVIGPHYKLKVHISTPPSINEKVKSIRVEYLNVQNTKKIKIFYELHILPSSSEREKERERERERERESGCSFGD